MNQISPIPANDDRAADVLVEPPPAGTLIEFLARAVRDPSIDVHKLEAIYRMQREIVADERRAAFHRAMNAVQSAMQPVVRDALNRETQSKFATVLAVDTAIRPIYSAHGFALSFTETPNDAPELKITCLVTRDGHQETYFLSALPDTVGPQGKANKTNVQGTTSSVTYLRRYLTCMIFNVALRDDNDGNRQRPSNDTGELISRVQATELRTLLAACSADPKAADANEVHFLNKMGMGDLRSIADVRPNHYAKLRMTLIEKRKRMDAANVSTGVAA